MIHVNGVALIPEGDMVVRADEREGSFEPLTFDYFLNEIKELSEDDCFIDVGAYTGIYSIFARKSNSKIKIVAFEPNPYCLIRTSENFALNFKSLESLKFFELYNVALSDENGIKEFHTKKSMKLSSGSMVGTNTDPVRYNDTRDLVTETLDSFEFNENKKPALIKIDVEGHEFEVLSGAIGILEQYKPKLIIEINDEEHEKAVKGLLSHFGYKHILVLDGRNFIFE